MNGISNSEYFFADSTVILQHLIINCLKTYTKVTSKILGLQDESLS